MPSPRVATTLPESKYGWPVYADPDTTLVLGYRVFNSRDGYLDDYFEVSTDLPWSPALLGELQIADGEPHNSGGLTTGSEQALYRRQSIGLRPLVYAAGYGNATGWCPVCGVLLTGDLITAGIHPVCAERFGVAR